MRIVTDTPDGRCRMGFTLIELLVVVAIIALLIAILLPTLSKARDAGKLATCGSNLRQLGFSIHAYATEYRGYIPRGPDPAHPFDFTGNHIATNQLWVGAGSYDPPQNQHQYQGLGRLLVTTCPDPRVLFCPADDNYNLEHSEPHIGTDQSAYGSYVYRQLDQIPDEVPAGMLDEMGENEVDGGRVKVEALAMDTNSLGPEPYYYHSNHDGEVGNVLYRDASVRRYENLDNCLALPPEAFAGLPDPTGIIEALDQLLVNVDHAYAGGAPSKAPRIDPER